jgi:hypothetical protein
VAEREESAGLTFQSYLIMPVQRIPRYKLLLEVRPPLSSLSASTAEMLTE